MQIDRRTDCQSVLQSLGPGYVSIRRSPKAAAWFKVVKWRVIKAGWLGSSPPRRASPQSVGLGPGGVAIQAPTPATPEL